MAKRAVFFDRDGTLIEDLGFIRRVEDVRLLPQVGDAIRKLNGAGWAVVVVTNQSGVARGLLTEDDVAATNKRMTDLLAKQGAKVDAVYVCPHLAEGKVPEYSKICDCRKPRPGMFLKASVEHGVDLASSVTVGATPRHVEAGLAAGTKAVLIAPNPNRAEKVPDSVVRVMDIMAASKEILERPGAKPTAKSARPAPAKAEEKPEAKPEAKPALKPEEKPAAKAPEKPAEKPVEKSAEKPVEKAAEKPAEKPAPAAAMVEPEKPAPVAGKAEPAAPASAPERVIPIHRAPKEFTPEPEEAAEAEPAKVGAAPAARAPETPIEPSKGTHVSEALERALAEAAATASPLPTAAPPSAPPGPKPAPAAPAPFTPRASWTGPSEKPQPAEDVAPPSPAGQPSAPARAPVPQAEPARPVPCGRCAREIPTADIEAGRAYHKDGVSICRDCIVVMQTQRVRGKEVSNEEVLRELQNITRALTYERFSYWHVFGAIAQAGALSMMIITALRDAGPIGVLWAIALQLLALTFFVLGSR